MRRFGLFGLILFAFLTLAFGLQFSSAPSYAADVLQDLPHLDGMRVYFAESNGEPSRFDRAGTGISRYADLLRGLGAEVLTLEWRSGIPQDANLIVIPGPGTDFNPNQTARLWAHINNGGSVLMIVEPFQRGPLRTRGFFELTWPDMGLRAADDIVVTERDNYAAFFGAEVTAEPTLIDFNAPTTLSSDIITRDYLPDHPITATLTGPVVFFGSRSLEVDTATNGVQITPLIFSPSIYYGETDATAFAAGQQGQYNIGIDTGRSALTLAAAFEHLASGGRMVLIGDREFIRNGNGMQTSPSYSGSFVYPDNARFLLRSTVWLLRRDQIDLSFPTPAATGTATITPSPTPTITPTPDPAATPSS